MFEVTEVKQYDKHTNYGTDWCTDYYISTNQSIDTIEQVIDKLIALGYQPYGQCSLKRQDDKIILQTIMY